MSKQPQARVLASTLYSPPGNHLPGSFRTEPRPPRPAKTSNGRRTLHPEPPIAVTRQALAGYLDRHGFQMAMDELAQWHLGQRLTTRKDGATELSALHDQHGNAAVRYRKDKKGTLTLDAAGTGHPLPKWLERNRYGPLNPNPKPRPLLPKDAPRFPEMRRIQYAKEQHHQLMFTSTRLAEIMRRLLALRLLARTAEIASDYLPNRHLRQAISHINPYETNYINLESVAHSVATQALLAQAGTGTRRDQLETQLVYRPGTLHVGRSFGNTERDSVGRAFRDWDEPRSNSLLDRYHNLPPKPGTENDIASAAGQLNTDLVLHMLDRDTLQVLADISGPPAKPAYVRLPQTALEEYNAVLDSLPAYAALAKTAPGLARTYLKNYSAPRQNLKSAGQIVQRLRRRSKLTPRQWRIFHRLVNHKRIWPSRMDALKLTARTAAAANQSLATGDALLRLHDCQYPMDHHRQLRKGAGRAAHRAAWNRAVHAFLTPGGPTPTQVEMRQVSEAMTDRLGRDLPWGPGSWQQMVTRAARWQMKRLDDLETDPFLPSWPAPPLPAHQRRGYTLTPLVTQPARQAASLLVGQWLQRYAYDPSEDRPVMYLATAPRLPPAVLEVNVEQRAWAPGWITRPPHLKQTTIPLQQMLAELAKDCQEAGPPPRRVRRGIPEADRYLYPPDQLSAFYHDQEIPGGPYGEVTATNLSNGESDLTSLPSDDEYT